MRFLYFIISFFLCSAAHSQVAKDQTFFRHGIFAPAYGQVSVIQSDVFKSTFVGLSGGWQVLRFGDYLSVSLGVEAVGLGKGGTLSGSHWVSLLGGVSQLVVMPGSSFGAIVSMSSLSGYDEYDNSGANLTNEKENLADGNDYADIDDDSNTSPNGADSVSNTWRHRDISLTKGEVILFYSFEPQKMFTLGYGSESFAGKDSLHTAGTEATEDKTTVTDILELKKKASSYISFGFRISQF